MRLSPLDPLTYMMRLAVAQAHYLAGRYDEASSWADMVLRERPAFFPPLMIGAASAAMADRPAEATRLRQRLQLVDPTLRLSTLKETFGPYRNTEDLARYTEGLWRAGLPEREGDV